MPGRISGFGYAPVCEATFGWKYRLFVFAILTCPLMFACGGGNGVAQYTVPPSIDLTAAPASFSIAPGTSTPIAVTLHVSGSVSGSTQVSIGGLPPGITTSPASPFVMSPGTQNVMLIADPYATNGTFTLQLQATNGSLSSAANTSMLVAGLADFRVLLICSDLAVRAGGSTTCTLLAGSIGPGATDYSVLLSVSSLPTGVTASFSTNPVLTASQIDLTFTAATNAQRATSFPVTIAATRSVDGAQRTALLFLSSEPPPGNLPTNRSGFIPLYAQPRSAVFDAVHKLVFASAPDLDVVSAISTVTHQVIKQIPVPNPQGLDLTLGNQDLIVGTGTDQFYTIDTSQLAVVARTTLPPIATGAPPLSVQPVWPIVTSSGTILFVVNGDFPNGVAQWNPASKTIIRRPDSGVGNTAMAMRSADGSKAMFYDPLNGAASIYDAVSDKFVPIPCTYRGVPYCGRGAVNPGGTQFALCLPSGVTIYGPIGNLTQQLDTGGCYGAVYTSDGRSLLVASFLNSALEILTYDATTFQLSATAPGFGSTVANSSAPFRPEIPFTVDDTRLIYGKANRGIALDDSTNTQDIPPDAGPLVWLNFADPGEGSLTASTPVTIWTQGFTDVPDAFFGEKRGTNAHLNGLNLQVAAPPADTPGPVTIKIEEPNGILGFLPLGFSYGSVIFPQVPQAVPRDGGVTADIYGYGLGADLLTFATQVTMGAQNAQVTLHGGIETGGEDYPFALQHLQVTVPPALQSGPVNLNVTTPVGSATLPQGIHYLKSAQNVTSPDTFTDLAYDQKRNRLYLSAGDHVDVIDLASNAFLPPISLPQVNGARKAAGLTVMPNGSRLLVSNNGDRSIAVIDPDLPSNATAVGVPLALPLPPSQCTPGPGRIAATSTGKAYAAIIDNPLLGCPTRGLIELDIPSLTATVNADGPSGPYISAARNGNAVVIGGPNDVSVLDLQTNAWQYRQLDSNSNLYEYAVSGDANLFAINTIGYGTAHQDRFLILNPGLNLVGNILQPEFYYSTGYRVAGLQMHDSGSLLYAPKRQGIEIYDVHHGDQRERILVSQDLTPIEPRASQVAIDETGSRIFLIAQSGLVIVQLDSVPLSLGSVNPSTGSASGGVVVTLRGSGFEPAAQVKVDTAAAVVTFVDMNTLQITTPSTPVGTVGITITNPDGQTYTLDDAYTAQ